AFEGRPLRGPAVLHFLVYSSNEGKSAAYDQSAERLERGSPGADRSGPALQHERTVRGGGGHPPPGPAPGPQEPERQAGPGGGPQAPAAAHGDELAQPARRPARG